MPSLYHLAWVIAAAALGSAAPLEPRTPDPALPSAIVCLVDNIVLSFFQGSASSSALAYCSSYISVPQVTSTIATTTPVAFTTSTITPAVVTSIGPASTPLTITTSTITPNVITTTVSTITPTLVITSVVSPTTTSTATVISISTILLQKREEFAIYRKLSKRAASTSKSSTSISSTTKATTTSSAASSTSLTSTLSPNQVFASRIATLSAKVILQACSCISSKIVKQTVLVTATAPTTTQTIVTTAVASTTTSTPVSPTSTIIVLTTLVPVTTSIAITTTPNLTTTTITTTTAIVTTTLVVSPTAFACVATGGASYFYLQASGGPYNGQFATLDTQNVFALTTQPNAAAKFSLDAAGHLVSNGLLAGNIFGAVTPGSLENVAFSQPSSGYELTCVVTAGFLVCGPGQWESLNPSQIDLEEDAADGNSFGLTPYAFNVIACT